MNIHQKYRLKKIINTSGRMTILGVSTPKPEIGVDMLYGLNHFFDMSELVENTGQYIAKLLAVESAHIVSCASAGIVQSVAAVITQNDMDLILNPYQNRTELKREIIIPKGHNVNFGAPVETMVYQGGGILVEAGFANECSSEQIISKISENTAAILYVKSHHCVQKSVLSVQEAAKIAQKYQIPLIVDAAAEEDLTTYYEQGASLVIYSGAKAIEGPSSGLVIGKKQYIDWLKMQSKGIGRAMKIGKESILGLTRAIEYYLNYSSETGQEMIEKMTPFVHAMNTIMGIKTRIVWDSAGRDIARAEIEIDQALMKSSAKEWVSELKKGEVAAYFREYKVNENKIEVDVRSVTREDLAILFNLIKVTLEPINDNLNGE